MSRQLFEEARKVLTQEAAVKLDPVGQEDKDIDNDGDADKTDSYLKKRRGAISAAIAKSKNESALSDEDVAKLKSILGEMKKKEEEMEDEEDDEKEMKKEEKEQVDEMQVANKYALKGPQPADVPAFMRKGNARKTFPVKLDDLKRKDTMSDIENLRKMEEVEESKQEDFELIEKINFEVAENPTYRDYFNAALKMAQVESFAELDEEDQQYIMSEMEKAFTNNDTAFILEADMMGDMNDTVQRLRKAGHKVEDMGKDFKGNPYYVYIDKGSNMRRKVIYKGNQKVTQNMGRAQPEKEEE